MRESTTMAFSKDGTKEVRKEWEGGKKYTIEKIICSKVGHGYWYTLLAWNEDYKMVYKLMSANKGTLSRITPSQLFHAPDRASLTTQIRALRPK